MTIITQIGTFFKGIPYKRIATGAYNTTLMTLNNRWVQGATAGTVGAIAAYNIVDMAITKTNAHSNEEMGKGYTDLFVASQTSSKESNLLEKVKGFARERMFDARIYPAYVKVKNFVLSAGEQIVNHGLDIAAITGALSPWIFKRIPPAITKTVAAVSTAFLMLRAARLFVVDVLGIGKKGL